MNVLINEYNNKIAGNNDIIENLTNRIIDNDAPFNYETFVSLNRKARETGDDSALVEYKKRRAEKDAINGALSNDIYSLKIQNRLLMHNIKTAFICDTLPVVVDVLNKYAGKPYGEKTKQRINDEIKTACGCYIYFDNYYLNVCVSGCVGHSNNDYKVTIKYDKDANNDTNFLIGNKIQPLSMDILNIYGSHAGIIENVSEYANNIINLRREIFKKADALNDEIKKYNSLTTDFLPDINTYISIFNDVFHN